jgi:hypothetical protein
MTALPAARPDASAQPDASARPGHQEPLLRPAALAAVASLGVAATSFASLPHWLLVPATVAWVGLLAAGALRLRWGALPLVVAAGLTKAATVALVVWALTHPASPIGPHGVEDWIPLGATNAGTGLCLLHLIRERRRARPTTGCR